MQPKSDGPRRAAGFVVFRGSGPFEWLLLRSAAHGAWGFPKGHLEHGESVQSASWRELEEETGIRRLDVVPGFSREISYAAERKGVLREKIVVYMLGSHGEDTVKLSGEHDSAQWLRPEDAMKLIAFENLRGVFGAAVATAWMRRGYSVSLPDGAEARWGRAGLAESDRWQGLAAARSVLSSLGTPADSWVAHSLTVAALSRAIADALARAGGEIRPAFVEAAGVLHDAGRILDHDLHGFAGFEFLEAIGLPELARISAVHWMKGRTPAELEEDGFGRYPCDHARARAWASVPLSLEEEALVLADSAVSGDRVVGVEKRSDRASERYGDTPWTHRNREIARRLKAKIESIAGLPFQEIAARTATAQWA